LKRALKIGIGVASLALLFLPVVAAAQRPFFATFRATPVEPSHLTIESHIAFDQQSDDHRATGLSLGVRYGLLYETEVSAHLPYLYAERNGKSDHHLGDLLLGAKFRLIRGRAANPLSVATLITVKVPSAGEQRLLGTTGEADIGLFAIASKTFAPISAHANLGYVFNGNPPGSEKKDQFHYALAVEYPADLFFTLFGELLGSVQVGHSLTAGPWSLGAGTSYAIDETRTIDGSVAAGLTDDAPEFSLRVGMTWALP